MFAVSAGVILCLEGNCCVRSVRVCPFRFGVSCTSISSRLRRVGVVLKHPESEKSVGRYAMSCLGLSQPLQGVNTPQR